jgi:ATP-dependent helicase HrpA
LERDKDGLVNLRLFRRAEEAVRGTPGAVRRLAELALGKDIAWLAKELRGFGAGGGGKAVAQSFADALPMLGKSSGGHAWDSRGTEAQEHVLAHLLRLEPVLPLTEKRFEGLLEKVRKELPLVTQRTRDLFKQVHEQRDQIARGSNRYPGMEADLARLVPGDLLLTTPHGQLLQVLRYLKAVRIRAERAGNNPAKDADKAQLIADWDGWETFVPAANREVFRWLMEEYRVQVFAQELGTAQAVSVKRLEALL